MRQPSRFQSEQARVLAKLGGGMLAVGAVAFVMAACADSPLGSDGPVRSRVQLDLSRFSQNTCAQSDVVELTVAPTSGGNRQTLVEQVGEDPGPDDCFVSFDISVEKGRVDFSAAVRGNRRVLLRGSRQFEVERDGFTVNIPLTEVDAMRVQSVTEGDFGPQTYQLFVTQLVDQLARDSVQDTILRNDRITLGALAAGTHRVRLDDFEPCAVSLIDDGDTIPGLDRATVVVPEDSEALVDVGFTLRCMPADTMGRAVVVAVATTGPGGPGSYGVGVSTARLSPRPISKTGTVAFDDVPPGPAVVTLSGIAPCTLGASSDPNPSPVTVPDADTVSVSFAVDCTGLVTGALKTSTSTQGTGGPNLYALFIDSVFIDSLTKNTSRQDTLSVGVSHQVELRSTIPCSVPAGAARSVMVTEAAVTTESFAVECAGDLVVETRTSGGGSPPGSYTLMIGTGSAQTIGLNDTRAVGSLISRPTDVTLAGFGTCLVSPGPTQRVTPPAGGTLKVIFDVFCPPGASLQVNVVTVGSSGGTVGHTISVTGATGSPTVQSTGRGTTRSPATAIFSTLPPGSYQVGVNLFGGPLCTLVSQVPGNPIDLPPDPGTVLVTLNIDCTDPTDPGDRGAVRVITQTTGANLDPDGYMAEVDTMGSSRVVATVGVNDTIVISDIPTGFHDVELVDIAANCDALGPKIVKSAVAAGDTTDVAFDVICVATGSSGDGMAARRSGRTTLASGPRRGDPALPARERRERGSRRIRRESRSG